MADSENGDVTAATPVGVKTVARGIPAHEVNPSNELLDGENLDRKLDMIENEPVRVDPSGTRLEHEGAPGYLPPPASANLELRQRAEKLTGALNESIGKGPEREDSMVAALENEKRGLQARGDAGDERAGKRVSQVDEALSARKSAAADRKAAASSQPVSSVPEGRTASAKGKTTA
jgi:hypothetical protein